MFCEVLRIQCFDRMVFFLSHTYSNCKKIQGCVYLNKVQMDPFHIAGFSNETTV